jgi:hypothetical protein
MRHLWREVAVFTGLIIVLFVSPYEKAAYQINFDFDVAYGVSRLCRAESQS